MNESLITPSEAIIHCPRCGQDRPADSRDKHICVDCAKAENNRYMHLRMHNDNWVEAAADAGIDLWLQQPGETQWEYTVWQCYRDMYPGKKPTIGSVAKQLNTTSNAISKIAARWSFPTRMQAWIAECDRITLAQRRSEILGMNKDYIDMSARIREKHRAAIAMLNPAELAPKDINALFKTAAELERKARVDSIEQGELLQELNSDHEHPELKKSPTKFGDLGEVVSILLNAGALGSVTQIGVRETREVVVKDGTGATSTLIEEG